MVESNVSRREEADRGRCCRSSCGSHTPLVSTQFGRVLNGASVVDGCLCVDPMFSRNGKDECG